MRRRKDERGDQQCDGIKLLRLLLRRASPDIRSRADKIGA